MKDIVLQLSRVIGQINTSASWYSDMVIKEIKNEKTPFHKMSITHFLACIQSADERAHSNAHDAQDLLEEILTIEGCLTTEPIMTRIQAELALKTKPLTVEEEYALIKEFPELSYLSPVARALDMALEVTA